MTKALTLILTLLAFGIQAAERPNIILIMVDDMGFSDLGYHGGEIDTPNIDALAHGGVRFSQFHNSGRCCPTRATLMTGLHPHQTGIGHMTNPPNSSGHDNGIEGYRGFLNRNCVTIAEALKPAGYATLMAGKWHLGHNNKDRWPLQRGFDKYFGCISGATRFFYPESPRGMTFGNEDIDKPESTTDEDFYTTDAFTDYAIRFMSEHKKESGDKPFFLYLAYTAPHWPLQAFEDDIAKYRGKYRKGWDALRKERLARQKELGLIGKHLELSPKTEGIPDWDTIDEKKQDEMDLKMAIYAAMVDRVDQNIGRLLAHLKKAGTYEDTLILFLSDNGGCQEGGMLGRGEFYDIEKRNQQPSNSYGEAWANASNTPFRLYKHYNHEGGTSTPFFMHWPSKIQPRKDWYRTPAQLIDVVPTLLDVAGATYPETYKGNKIHSLDGLSLRPAFEGKAFDRGAPIFIEHENNASMREGDWKLVGKGVAEPQGVNRSKWELYNIAKDRTETTNLASAMPEKVKEMADKWEAWAKRAKVYPKKKEPQPEEFTPQIGNVPFTVTAVVRQKNPNGVVVSHGGNAFGYSLFFDKGVPAFAFRNQSKLTTIKGKQKLSGRVELKASVDAENITLFANGKQVAQAKSGGLMNEQPGLGMFVGADGVHAVGDYKVPNEFNGKVVSHNVDSVRPKVTMRTPWAGKVTAENVWQEYPRPALKRDNWTNLNGHWNYAVTAKDAAEAPAKWAGKILVPFAIEAPLSGVEKGFTPNDALWYQRSFKASPDRKSRTILNFEAVDYACTLWINGKEVGSHVGGNLPFSFDITDAVKKGDNQLLLKVTDSTDARGAYQLHGKQRLNPKGIWYTPVSGIWQTVWMEEVPKVHIEELKVITQMDGTISLEVKTQGGKKRENVEVTLSLDGKKITTAKGKTSGMKFKVENPQLWSPESPTLYNMKVKVGDDVVDSYVGIREVGKRKDAEGHWRFTLNGKDIFHWGTLDQGWWPDGLLTPPSDEAMRWDIDWLKAAGFNMIRKHIKVEPRRYYTYCDEVGMLLWQDQVSSMSDNPKWTRLQPDPETVTWPEAAHKQYMAELQEMIDTLHNHPSIVQWVPFNERWGQHQTVEVGKWTVAYDPTRHVNIASGGNFFEAGHIVDEHRYPHPGFPFELNTNGRFDPFIKVMGEFGGHGFPVDGHVWDPNKRNWGYGGLPQNKEEWIERYKESIRILAELKKQGISAGVYTQTTDVEGEINGLITYDRKVPKLPAAEIRKLNAPVMDKTTASVFEAIPQDGPVEVADAMPAEEIAAGLKSHDRALFVKAGWIRDPYIILGPDDYFYLTGTTPLPEDPRQKTDPYNTGLQDSSIVGWKAQVWRSKDLIEWEDLNTPFHLKDGIWNEAKPKAFADTDIKQWRLWAPELHWLGDKWALVHTSPSPVKGANLSLTQGAKVTRPWSNPMGTKIQRRHDPSLFNDNGTWWMIWGATSIAPLKKDFSDFAGKPVKIGPSGDTAKMGHEGCLMQKIGDKYVLFGTGWSTGRMRQGSYNLYYATADKITGPYSERQFAGRFLGHGTPFKDKEGRWWCTAFFNGNVPPLSPKDARGKDLSATAHTINQQGVTIVPMNVRVNQDGSIHIRAKDPDYAFPGPDEAQKFAD